MSNFERSVRIAASYFFFMLGAMAVFAGVFFVVNWASAVGDGGWREQYPPLVSLYLSAPGTFACLAFAIICIGAGVDMSDKVNRSGPAK